ncbi:4-(cytidine 5'-diphospho)-2-C-methyl-D-erythritol kinase [Thiohalocapsa marina]|uniref:4-(cytidine 5'-diphospho)-2-C-methyl-D-erythritol kinase n=1 Tax=Thiohalocapsa marina TaxID=424902 RepID=UPI0036D83555
MLPEMLAQPAADGAWLAPAKLNLMLKVVGRRADGYHLLQTVFQFIDRCDRLHFQLRADGRVQRGRGALGIDPAQDLVVRAALALKARTGCDAGVDIDVDKCLPMGGGLGGGSSNAATTLLALNQLWGLGLTQDQLAEIGLGLGADVPVFVRGQAAWAEGVGERLTPVTMPEPWYLVLTPPTAVATAAVFADPALTRNSPPVKMADFIEGDEANDCLPVVLDHYPSVAEAFHWLEQQASAQGSKARLTGTGGCVFAAFSAAQEAQQVAADAPAPWNAFVARGRNRSPLFGPA